MHRDFDLRRPCSMSARGRKSQEGSRNFLVCNTVVVVWRNQAKTAVSYNTLQQQISSSGPPGQLLASLLCTRTSATQARKNKRAHLLVGHVEPVLPFQLVQQSFPQSRQTKSRPIPVTSRFRQRSSPVSPSHYLIHRGWGRVPMRDTLSKIGWWWIYPSVSRQHCFYVRRLCLAHTPGKPRSWTMAFFMCRRECFRPSCGHERRGRGTSAMIHVRRSHRGRHRHYQSPDEPRQHEHAKQSGYSYIDGGSRGRLLLCFATNHKKSGCAQKKGFLEALSPTRSENSKQAHEPITGPRVIFPSLPPGSCGCPCCG